jgi:ABC-type multidrug transport system fused ATPase/permease subunit
VEVPSSLDSRVAVPAQALLRFFLRRHAAPIAWLSVLALVVGVLEGLNLAAFIPVLDGLVGSGGAQRDNTLVNGVNRALGSVYAGDPFLVACGVFLVLTITKGVMAIAHEYASANVTGRILHDYRMELIDKYRKAPLFEVERCRVGALVNNLIQPPIMVTRLLYSIPRIVVDAFRLLFVLALLLYVEPVLTLGLIALAGTLYMLFSRKLSIYLYQLAIRRRALEQQMNSTASEWLYGMRPLRMSGRDEHWVDQFRRDSRAARSIYLRTSFIMASPRHVFEMAGFGLLMVGIIMAYVLDPNAFNAHVVTIGFFAMGLARVLPSVAALARAPLELRTALPEATYLYSTLNAKLREEANGTQVFNGLTGGIAVDDACVDFPGRGNALAGASVAIPRGSSAAIVGASGSGKSTLLNVILGIQPLTSGRVAYDGTDLRLLDRASVLRKVGYVGQDVVLFHGSIRDNSCFFREEIPFERVTEAARLANIHDFVESLPSGYEAQVGERGVNFSGGQAQRLAIARALIHDPEILVLDEPTSALDSVSEQGVLQALQQASKNRTVILVTHRLTAVKWVDAIFVLHDGRVVETGDWQQLMETPQGRLRAMCAEQHLIPAAGTPAYPT